VSRPTAALIVGHYGRGTGATYPPHALATGAVIKDEVALANRDAVNVFGELARDNLVTPLIFSIDRHVPVWKYVHLTTSIQLDIKLRWIEDVKPDVVVEFHYNSFSDESVEGNEVVAAGLTPFAGVMAHALHALPNKSRATKVKRLKIFRATPPTVIVEPAFLAEKRVESIRFAAMVAVAVKHGVYKYLGKG